MLLKSQFLIEFQKAEHHPIFWESLLGSSLHLGFFELGVFCLIRVGIDSCGSTSGIGLPSGHASDYSSRPPGRFGRSIARAFSLFI